MRIRNFGLVIVIILGFTFVSRGQERATFLEMGTTPYVIDGTYRAIGELNIGKIGTKHAYSIGATVLYASDIVSSTQSYPQLTGVQLGYSYYPNGHTNRWNMYFFSKLMVQNIADEWLTISWVDERSRYEEFKYLSREVLTTTFLGYGLHLKLGERFVLNQSVGAGLYYSFLDGDEITADAPELSETFGASYNSFGVVFGVNLGVKYVFGKANKE